MKESIVFTASSQRIGTRAYQQDRCFSAADESGSNAIGIVCDGMGGMEAGEKASQLALEQFIEDYDDLDNDINNYYEFLYEEMKTIDRKVADLESDDGRSLDTGSTLVAAIIKDGYAQWVSVGDSKIFIIRGKEMVSLVREHNYLMVLNYRLKNGRISMEDYEREASYGAGLISYIGMGNISLIEANREPFRLRDRDMILISSDGLTNALTEDQILSIVRENPGNLGYIHRRLQDEAGYASEKGQDNTSIVTMLYREI